MAESGRYTNELSYKLEAGIAVLVLVQTIGVFLWMNPPYWNEVMEMFGLSEYKQESKKYDENNEVSFERQTNDSSAQMEEKEEAHTNTINENAEIPESKEFESDDNQYIQEFESKYDSGLQLKMQNLSASLKQSNQKMDRLKNKNQKLSAKCELDVKEVEILTQSNSELQNQLNANMSVIDSLKAANEQTLYELKKLNQELVNKCAGNCAEIQENVVGELKEMSTIKYTNDEFETKLEKNLKQINENAETIQNMKIGLGFFVTLFAVVGFSGLLSSGVNFSNYNKIIKKPAYVQPKTEINIPVNTNKCGGDKYSLCEETVEKVVNDKGKNKNKKKKKKKNEGK